MMKIFFLSSLVLLSTSTWAGAYLGGNYGLSTYNSSALDTYKVTPKGRTFGGFLGYGFDFFGLELVYQNLSTTGEIDHDGAKHDLISDASMYGAALRVGLELVYFRAGLAKYSLKQSVSIEDETSRSSAEDLYDIQNSDTPKNGIFYGLGIHHKLKGIRVFADYTRYQINQTGYFNAVSAGVIFNIPDRMFSFQKP